MFNGIELRLRQATTGTDAELPGWLKLRDGEVYLGNQYVMDNRIHDWWMVSCAILAKVTVIFLICVHWIFPDYRGLIWQDRLNRGVFWLHTLLFDSGVLHITSQRMVIGSAGKSQLDLPLRRVTGIETKPLLLKGNLFIHQARGKTINLWVNDRAGAVAMLQQTAGN